MSRQKQSQFWLYGGPSALVAAFLLLMIRAAPLMGRPVWLFGLGISLVIACMTTYLAILETREREQGLLQHKLSDRQKVDQLKTTLDEANQLYREKVDHLEKAFAFLEKEHTELQSGYEEIHDRVQKERARASDLHTSLEDALEEIRFARQCDYLKENHWKKLPKDLPSKHQQLREQFDEKSLVLDQTRRRLFAVEGLLFAAKKDQAFDKLENDEELAIFHRDLVELLEENQALEGEIRDLEVVVSRLIKDKSAKVAAPKKKEEPTLELQF